MNQRPYKKYWFNLILIPLLKVNVQESCGIVPDLDYYNYLNATGKNITQLLWKYLKTSGYLAATLPFSKVNLT